MIDLPQPTSKNVLRSLLLLLIVGAFSGPAQAQCPVNANFNHYPSYICQGANLTFNNTTTGGAIGQSWYENITLFSSVASPTRTFSTPGAYVISLVATNGTCLDTAQSAIMVSPTITGGLVPTNPTCFGGSNGSVNLTPGGGTPNRSISNVRATNDYTNANTVSNAGYAGGITVEAWVKPRAGWTTGDGIFMAFNQTGGSGNRFFIGYNPDVSLRKFVYFDDNTGNQFWNVVTPVNAWYHVAVSISSANVISLYINGVLDHTVNTNGGWVPQAGDRFNMGQEWDFSFTSQHFDGFLDEVRVWNTVLTAPTILSNRNSCVGITNTHPNWANLVAYYSMNEGSGTYVFDRSGRNNHGTRVNGTAYGTAAESNWGCFSDGSGYSYTWSTGAVTQDITGRPAGTYTVTVGDGAGAGCNFVGSSTLTNPAAVAVTITPAGPVPICLGGSTPLAATGANTYSWSPGTSLSATNVANVTANPTSTITYTCTGTNAVGCTGTQTVQVVVNPLPTATITGTNVICNGQSTTLTGGGGTSYAWSNGPLTPGNTVSPTTTTTYTVTATNSFNCTDTELMTVTVNPLPTVTFAGDTTLCLGDTTTITAAGGTGYSWSNGTLTAANTVFPAATTSYTVTVTDANTCQRSRSVTVTVNPLPVVSITGDTVICIGDTTTITAAGGTGYSWSNGTLTAPNTVFPTTTTNYVVTVTDANTCRNSDNVSVTVNPLPVLSFSGVDTICDGDTTQITVGGASSYVWWSGAITPMVDVSPSLSTYYSVMGTDSNGCAATDSMLVTVNALPTVTITGNDTICAGDSTMLMGGGATSYIWSTGDLTSMITVSPSANTNYVLTGTDGNGCSNNASLGVVVNALPTPTITGLDSICVGDSTTLTASGGSSYFWSTFSANTSITVSPPVFTTYTVTATDANGCEGTASIGVTVNALPATPVITQSGNTMSTTAGFASYQWYFNGNPIPGANASSYTATQSGGYSVTVTNGSGCDASSTVFTFIFVAVNPANASSFGLVVFPNPNDGRFTIQLDLERDRNVALGIYDLAGKQVWNQSGDLPYGEWKQGLDLSHLSKGTYLLQVISEGQKVTRKIVVD